MTSPHPDLKGFIIPWHRHRNLPSPFQLKLLGVSFASRDTTSKSSSTNTMGTKRRLAKARPTSFRVTATTAATWRCLSTKAGEYSVELVMLSSILPRFLRKYIFNSTPQLFNSLHHTSIGQGNLKVNVASTDTTLP